MSSEVRVETNKETTIILLKDNLKIGKIKQAVWVLLFGIATLIFVWYDLIHAIYPRISPELIFFGAGTVAFPIFVKLYWNKFSYQIIKNSKNDFLISWPIRYWYGTIGNPFLANQHEIVIVNEPLQEIVGIKQPILERFIIKLKFPSRSVSIGGYDKLLQGELKKLHAFTINTAYSFRKEDVEKIASVFQVPVRFE